MPRNKLNAHSSGGNPERNQGALGTLFDTSNTAPVIIRDMDGRHSGWDQEWSRQRRFSPLLKRPRDYQDDRGLEFMHRDEADFMASLLLAPLGNLPNILERQAAIRALSTFPDLDELLRLRNQAYKVHTGAWDLLCYYGTDPGYWKANEERLISVYHQGITELPDYDESGFDTVGTLDVKELVEEGVTKIEEGITGFESFAKVLSKVPHRIFTGITEEIKGILAGTKQRLGRKAIYGESTDVVFDDLEEDEDDRDGSYYDDGYGYLEGFTDKKLKPVLLRLGSLVEFADIVRKDHWGAVTFDLTKPDFYIAGWNLERPKGQQVRNSSPDGASTVILSGANTSGKSFGMRMDFLVRLAAQATGFAPVEAGNLRLNQAFAFLDRASTQHDQDLSAFMSEVQNWNQVLPNLGVNTRLYVDEGFSTTSPDDQARLLLAVSRYIQQQGGSIVLASHNESLIRRSRTDPSVGIYHYRSDVQPDGKLVRHFTLTVGPDDSKAIAVARAKGFHPDMVEAAERYLRADYALPIPEDMAYFPEITGYTSEQRAQMKLQQQSLDHLVSDGPRNSLFRLYSNDKDFSPGYFLRNQSGGEGADGDLKAKFARMILFAQSLMPSQILERQKMFAELLVNKKFMKISGASGVLRVADHSIAIIANSQAEGINRALYPLSIDPKRKQEQKIELHLRDIEAVVSWLRLNAKVLGDQFEHSDLLERLKSIKEVKNAHPLLNELEQVHKTLPLVKFEDIPLDAISQELDDLLAYRQGDQDTNERASNVLQRRKQQHPDAMSDLAEVLKVAIGGLPLALKEYPYYQIGIEELVKSLRSTDSVYLHQSANLVETLFADMVSQVTSQQSLEPAVDLSSDMGLFSYSMLGRRIDSPFQGLLNLEPQKSPFSKELALLDTVCAGASIIDSQGFSPVIFNSSGKVEVVNGINLLKAKEEQVANSIVLGDGGSRLHVLTGPNGSGKTFFEKGAVATILAGLATGYAPAEFATMPIFDSVVYLDRVTEKMEKDLSAFANELVFWDELIGNLRNKRAVFAAVDEAFSTTSPLYQSALTYAAVGAFRNYGHYLLLSTHNHEAVDKLSISDGGSVEPYSFSFQTDAGKVSYNYQIQKGHKASHAIEVARTLGLKEEIVELATAL